MVENISEDLVSTFSRLVSAKMGLYFAEDRWRDLVRGARSAARELGHRDARACMLSFLSAPPDTKSIEVLASHLTVGETYFFRDRKAFDALQNRLFRELINSRSEKDRCIRVWSAGCATGEEAFSIAILLRRMLHDIDDWNITIMASDINPLYLRKALRAEYTKWSFRDSPSWLKEKYFGATKTGTFELSPHLRKMVTFFHHNLMADPYPSIVNNTNAMDLIFCRNVLMYFSPDVQQKVVKDLRRSLVEGGLLLVSPSELSQQLFSEFTAINEAGAVFYRNDRKLCVKAGRVSDRPPVENLGEKMESPLQPAPEMPEPNTEFPPAVGQALTEGERGAPPLDSYAAASSLYAQGCYVEAIDKILASPQLSEKDTKAIKLMARAYANQGKLEEALSWGKKATALAKMDPGSHYLLAVILQEQGRAEEASLSLKRALYLDQDFVLAHFALGNLMRRQGKVRQSARHFKNALELLQKYPKDDILAEVEGLTAGRLTEIIRSTTPEEAAG